MKTNAAGHAMIKGFETLRLEAYLCPAGKPTIGWGHTGDVKLGDKITEHQAEAILDVDLFRFEQAVDRLAPGVNENQFAALVSFAFNLGVAALEESSLLRYVRASKFDAATAEFKHWTHAHVNGQLVELEGLVKRRKAEAALFLTPVCYCGEAGCKADHT